MKKENTSLDLLLLAVAYAESKGLKVAHPRFTISELELVREERLPTSIRYHFAQCIIV